MVKGKPEEWGFHSTVLGVGRATYLWRTVQQGSGLLHLPNPETLSNSRGGKMHRILYVPEDWSMFPINITNRVP